MLRSLIHYRRLHLAVLAGAAVATAVLTGALIVGDSVRGSLRTLTLERLGRIDDAWIGQRFVREQLADDLAHRNGFERDFGGVVPAIVVRGTVVHGDTDRRAAGVQLIGIDDRFAELFDSGDAAEGLALDRAEGQLFPSIVINRSLALELGASVGDALILRFGSVSDVPRDTLMGEKSPEDLLGSLRVGVRRILPDEGVGRFSLDAHQQTPLNGFVGLGRLQRALEQDGRVNALLVDRRAAGGDLAELLRRTVTLDDYGLRILGGEDHLVVESREFVLGPRVERAILDVAAEAGWPVQPVQSYLANAMRVGPRQVPYSLVAAVDPVPGHAWSELQPVDGATPPSALADDEVWLNRWVAKQLDARVGDTLEMTYYRVDAQEELTEERARFRVAGVVRMAGLGGDARLTPDYPGIQDADDMASWDPPFPVELDRIRPEDEAYWDEYRALPKAFVSFDTGDRLWSTRHGRLTSVRIGFEPSEPPLAVERRLQEMLVARLDPSVVGLAFRPVREDGLRASAGATDFSGLFIGFSLFLIVSAAFLVRLLFGLGVEQRAREVGLRLAVGFPVRRVRRQLLAEGALIAGAGGLVGVALGVGYAAAMMLGLRTLWVAAVGSSRLALHAQPLSLGLGFAIGFLVVLFTISREVRRLRRLPPTRLLAGSTREDGALRPARLARWIAWLSLIGGGGLLAGALAGGAEESPAIAFSSGSLLLIAGLAFFAVWCRRPRGRAGGRRALLAMAARNSAWNPGRSILSVALVACACFVIVAVGANRRQFGEELERRDSGTGGFALFAEADVPLHQALDRPGHLEELGFDADERARLAGTKVIPLRVQPGDDASCLNLYRPERPTLFGVPEALIERGGFDFAEHLPLDGGATEPWSLLREAPEPGVVPAIGDANSVRWILHSGLGQDLEIEDASGQPFRLRIVALMRGSLFQSELLIPEWAFRERFPDRSGHAAFLIDAPPDRREAIALALESRLAPFGVDVTSTRERLAAFQVVEHTYLSTFQLLGALGLLLGTVGLAVVLLRNVLERRGELATMRAFGFRRRRLAWLIGAETALLLVIGMAIGTASALAAVAPRLATIHVPWLSLALTLAVVAAVGMLASVAAVRGALRVPLLPALKAER